MNIFLSLITGILAAFSPCVVVLFPLVLFRFVNQEKTQWKNLVFLIIGFLVSYIIFAYSLSSIFTSTVQNGIKLGAGILFIVLGILSLMNRINPLNFPLIKNPFLLGIFFSLIISFNPCTIPFLSVIIALNATGLIIINMLFFALGLLIPTILFVLFGQNFLNFANKSKKFIVILDKLMNFILIIAGIYLIIIIKGLFMTDIYVALGLLAVVFIILIKSFFIINSKKDIFKIKNVLLIVALLLMLVVIFIHCNNRIEPTVNEDDHFNFEQPKESMPLEQNNCSITHVKDCATCYKCISFFFIALVLGAIGIFLNKKFRS